MANQTRLMARKWLLLALVMFCAQSVMLGTHVMPVFMPVLQSAHEELMTRDSSNSDSGCHAISSIERSELGTQQTLAPTDQTVTHSCCDGDCSMAHCHMTGALFVYRAVLARSESSPPQRILKQGSLVHRISSLYRPPIIS